MELPAEERPLLREARNVRNSHLAAPTTTSFPVAPDGGEGVSARLVNGTSKASTGGGDQPYAIGDRKVFGMAQVSRFRVLSFYLSVYFTYTNNKNK